MDPLSSRLATARARHALRESGLPYQGELERASSTTNEAYLSDEYVIRTNTEINNRLSREADVYALLPQHPWSPVKVACGGGAGTDFLIIERKAGGALAHIWPELIPEQRKRAIHGLGDYLQRLHSSPVPASLTRLRRCPQLLDGTAKPITAPLMSAVRELQGRNEVDHGVLADVTRTAEDNLPFLDGFDESHLIHGDLTFENLLWHHKNLSAIVDFEWCRGGPADLDLDVLFRCCAFPQLHVATAHMDRTRAADYAEVLPWMAEVYPTLFEHPNLFERLVLYALSFEVGQLLLHPFEGPRRNLDPDHPYNRVAALLTSGGYVADLLDTIGVAR